MACHQNPPSGFSELMRSADWSGENITKDEARRDLSPPGSVYSWHPATQNPKLLSAMKQKLTPYSRTLLSKLILGGYVPCAVNRDLTVWDLIVPPGLWNVTPAHSLDASFIRPKVEWQVSRGHFVPSPPCVSGRLGALGPRTCPESHMQSQLRYRSLVVSITTPKPVGDNRQQAAP